MVFFFLEFVYLQKNIVTVIYIIFYFSSFSEFLDVFIDCDLYLGFFFVIIVFNDHKKILINKYIIDIHFFFSLYSFSYLNFIKTKIFQRLTFSKQYLERLKSQFIH